MNSTKYFRKNKFRKFKNKFEQWKGTVIASALILLVIATLRILGFLQFFEWLAYDWYGSRPIEQLFNLPVAEKIDDRFVIVEINEEAYRALRPYYPISDAKLADILENILAGDPAIVGLDLYRDLPVLPELNNGGERLEKIFQNNTNLIGIEKVTGSSISGSEPIDPPPILAGTDRVGANDVLLDPDGFLRRAFLKTQIQREANDRPSVYISFSWLVAGNYLLQSNIPVAETDSGLIKLGNTLVSPFNASDGGYINADDSSYQMLINWRIPPRAWHKVSILDVLNNKISPDAFKNKIVLIGATGASLNDLFNVPYYRDLFAAPEQVSGVEIQANIIKQLIDVAAGDRSLIKTIPNLFEWIWIVFWLLLSSILIHQIGFKKRRNVRAKNNLFSALNFLVKVTIIVFLANLSLFVITYGVYALALIWLPVCPPAFAIFGTGMFTSIAVYISQIKEANKYLNFRVRQRTQRIEYLRHELVIENQKLELANEEIKEKTEQLIATEKLSSLGEVFAYLCHDIGTPIAMIENNSKMAYEELIEQKVQLDLADERNLMKLRKSLKNNYNFLNDLQEYLFEIGEQSEKINTIVKSLYSHNYVDSLIEGNKGDKDNNNLTLVLTKQNLNNLTLKYSDLAKKAFLAKRKESLKSLKQKFSSNYHPLNLKVILAPEIENFYMDGNAFSRVILNLISNSCDATIERYSKTKSIDYYPRIIVTTKSDGEKNVKITVEDNGEGISAERLNKIFDPSYTTKRKRGGTGLGLFISYNLVRSKGLGEIFVESKLGVGTKIEFTWFKSTSEEITIKNQATCI